MELFEPSKNTSLKLAGVSAIILLKGSIWWREAKIKRMFLISHENNIVSIRNENLTRMLKVFT